jgi:hypothetical protein
MYRSRMSSSLVYRSGRYALIAFGLLGLFTSVQLACTFSDEPPSSPKKTNPVTDSGPIVEHDGGSSSGASSSGSSSGYGAYGGYGYGYGPDGCYGYGYGYEPTYEGTAVCE